MLSNCPDTRILPNSKVLVFDPRLFKDDISTPLSFTMRSAKVIKRYGERSKYNPQWIYPDLVDVIFDYDKFLSRGHFTNGVKFIE